ncbi:MAG: periplasmic heavy metal sensor [Caulobacterales bacterium]|nr:periplasmic heavy metal sensor [Caulobacterales bacterium]
MAQSVWRTTAYVSLAINLLVIGLLAGASFAGLRVAGPYAAAVSGPGPAVGPGIGPGFSARSFFQSLPAEERRRAMRTAKAERDRVRPLISEMHEARRAAYRSLSAKPFDREASDAAFQRFFEAERAVKARGTTVMLEIVAQLPDDVREEAVRASERGGWRFGPSGRRGPGPGGPEMGPFGDRPPRHPFADGPPEDGPPGDEPPR